MSIRAYIDGMTPTRILQLAARRDGFRTHMYRYREAAVVRRCRALANDGKLRRDSRTKEEVIWKITDAGRAALKAMP